MSLGSQVPKQRLVEAEGSQCALWSVFHLTQSTCEDPSGCLHILSIASMPASVACEETECNVLAMEAHQHGFFSWENGLSHGTSALHSMPSGRWTSSSAWLQAVPHSAAHHPLLVKFPQLTSSVKLGMQNLDHQRRDGKSWKMKNDAVKLTPAFLMKFLAGLRGGSHVRSSSPSTVGPL